MLGHAATFVGLVVVSFVIVTAFGRRHHNPDFVYPPELDALEKEALKQWRNSSR